MDCIFCGDSQTLETGACYSCTETAEAMGYSVEDMAL